MAHEQNDTVITSVPTQDPTPLPAKSIWWDANWSYYRVLPIVNSYNSYQMKIVVGKYSGGDVSCDGHCRDDFGDLRFVDVDNVTQLPFWIENYTPGVQATIWVNVSFDVETYQKIIMYYGNPFITTTSDGSSTFIFFDDFPGTSIDTSKWTGDTGQATVSNSVMQINKPYKIITIRSFKSPCALRANMSWEASGGFSTDAAFGFSSNQLWSNNVEGQIDYHGYNCIESCKNGSVIWPTSNFGRNTWQKLDFLWNKETPKASFFRDGVEMMASPLTTNVPDIPLHILLYTQGSGGTCFIKLDWVFVRQLKTTEPSWGTPSEEHFIHPPTANFTYTPNNPTNTTVIHFTDTSTDPDGTIVSWWWNFGDHYYSDLQNPIHCYYMNGEYTVTLTVKDNNGASSTFTVYINVIQSIEVLDQQQTQYNNNFALYTTRWGGQSFKPTVTLLTRVEVYMRKAGSPPSDVVLSVRSSLTGADLVSVSKPASQIPTSNGWVEFDFSDLTVTPGSTYYLVLKTTGGSSTNCYYWGYGSNTPYTNGMLWYSTNGGSTWTQYSQYDFCFKIYGFK